MTLKLALHHSYFFGFIPFDERGMNESGKLRSDPLVFGIDEIKIGEEYVLLLSSG